MKIILRKAAVISVLVTFLLTLTVSFASASGGEGNYHTVHYGETLFSIGRRYGVNPYVIANVNGLRNPDHIYAGQRLYIPSGYDDNWGNCGRQNCNDWGNQGNCDRQNCNGWGNQDNWNQCDWGDCGSKGKQQPSWDNVSHRDGAYGSNYHVVQRGETLYSISRRYGVSIWAIAEANGIYNLNRIYAGQVLHIPSGRGYY